MSDGRITADEAGLVLSGHLTFASVPLLHRQAAQLWDGLPEHARVELADTGRIDSAGLAFLVSLWREARRRGHFLVFEPVPERLAPLLELYDLRGVISGSAAHAAQPPGLH